MANFTISATLDENKNLKIDSLPPQNQGENRSCSIEISAPDRMVSGYDVYLEFLCPQNKRYVSPKMTYVAPTSFDEDDPVAKFFCDVPSCVLQEEGLVMLQVVARNSADNLEVFKSNYSTTTSFFVHRSVNATQTFEVSDYFAETKQTLERLNATVAEADGALLRLQDEFSAMQNYRAEMEGDIDAAKEEIREELAYDLQQEVATRSAETEALTQRDAEIEEMARNADLRLSTHRFNAQNPHFVTKKQIGLSEVENERQYSERNPNLSDDEPLPNGTADCGSATTYCRSDHIHPRDDTKADANNVLKLTTQNLTDEQKSRVRANIGAGTSSFSGSYLDLTDKPAPAGNSELSTAFGWTYIDESSDYMLTDPGFRGECEFVVTNYSGEAYEFVVRSYYDNTHHDDVTIDIDFEFDYIYGRLVNFGGVKRLEMKFVSSGMEDCEERTFARTFTRPISASTSGKFCIRPNADDSYCGSLMYKRLKFLITSI